MLLLLLGSKAPSLTPSDATPAHGTRHETHVWPVDGSGSGAEVPF